MTHNQYIANIQYKIDNLFYEYDTIEMGNYDYYNEYTNLNHYDRLIMEAEEKKGIIRRIIDGIMKIIRTAIDKVKSFFSKNKNIDSKATVKVNKNLVNRINIFKKKSSKIKLGISILTTAFGFVGVPLLIKKGNPIVGRGMDKLEDLRKKLSGITNGIRDIKTGEITKSEDTEELSVNDITIDVHHIIDVLADINKKLETILTSTPEDISKPERDFIQEINVLTADGSKIIDEMVALINAVGEDKIYKKTLDKYGIEKYRYNKLQGKISDKFGNGQQSNNKSSDTSGAIMGDMSTTYVFIQDIINGDLKNTISHCYDEELKTLANNYATKCKKLADWCIKHTQRDHDYTEEEYNKMYSDCKKDYDSIMSKKLLPADGGTHVVKNLKRISMYLNDIHSGAKKLQAIWDKNNK